ncbi:MAG: protein translocase SEC61 complex subunit gamma [Promethearchaeota archaeon]
MSISKDAPSLNKVQRFFLNSRRIFRIATKPSASEFWMMVKVSLIGLAVIGGLAFIIQLIANVISPPPPAT